MGIVANDPKKSDEQQPGGFGLMMDLNVRSCPQCRREVPDWVEECPDCGVPPVPRMSLQSALPDIPAHLLDEDASEGPDA
ncbi:hypothetical protein BH24ACT15_BH24ACT15_11320 [soil metagenome]